MIAAYLVNSIGSNNRDSRICGLSYKFRLRMCLIYLEGSLSCGGAPPQQCKNTIPRHLDRHVYWNAIKQKR